MPDYFCFACARAAGHVLPADPDQSPPSVYQLDKFLKHTAPAKVYPLNSVFASGDWNTYKNFMVTASQSGCLELDGARKTLLFYAGQTTGLLYQSGQIVSDCSGVTLVLTERSGEFHAFPSTFTPESQTCQQCGTPVPVNHYKPTPSGTN